MTKFFTGFYLLAFSYQYSGKMPIKCFKAIGMFKRCNFIMRLRRQQSLPLHQQCFYRFACIFPLKSIPKETSGKPSPKKDLCLYPKLEVCSPSDGTTHWGKFHFFFNIFQDSFHNNPLYKISIFNFKTFLHPPTSTFFSSPKPLCSKILINFN